MAHRVDTEKLKYNRKCQNLSKFVNICKESQLYFTKKVIPQVKVDNYYVMESIAISSISSYLVIYPVSENKKSVHCMYS